MSHLTDFTVYGLHSIWSRVRVGESDSFSSALLPHKTFMKFGKIHRIGKWYEQVLSLHLKLHELQAA